MLLDQNLLNWRMPIKWDREAERTGVRPRVFCASLADVFDNEVDPAWRRDLFRLIRRCENLDFLLLTKRIGNVRSMVPLEWLASSLHGAHGKVLYPMGWPENVWLGATVVNQEEADRDIPKLLAVPAAKRFLSMEPLLGPVDLNYVRQRIQAQRSQLARAINGETWLDWVIVGGESGPGARPMSPDWARRLRDQCQAAGVPFLFKQWGDWVPMLGQVEGVPVRGKATTSDGWVMGLAGKKAAGRLLDGRTHDGVPA